MAELPESPNGLEMKSVSVAIVSPDESWRTGATGLLNMRPNVRCQDIAQIGPDLREFAAGLAKKTDAVLLDVDCDPELMLRLAEALSEEDGAWVMAASSQSDMKLAVRFMRTGVREFFTLPVDPNEVAAALNRVAGRVVTPSTKPGGKLFSFLGAKGGVGVTTLAANFALTLAQESEKKTLIIDLGIPLGDVAINLGIRTDFSVHNALADPNRLDSSLLETLVTKHESGLALLGAPANFADLQPTAEAFDKLVTVARSSYDYVVVDAGARVDLVRTSIFEQASIAYLIAQVGISELRNANRMIIQFFAARGSNLQVVLNRYTQRSLLLEDTLDDAQITRTLTRAADWKIPDDYAAARRTRDTATPLAMIDSALSSKIRELARTAAEIPAEAPKKGFFRLLR